MKFSENWLRQHVKTTATRDELAATLTAIGLEVEGMSVLGEALDAEAFLAQLRQEHSIKPELRERRSIGFTQR